MDTYAVVVAGGIGQRMGKTLPKQYIEVAGQPILARTLRVFEQTEAVTKVIVVVPSALVQGTKNDIVGRFGFTKVESVVAGGDRRQDSVWNGLQAIRPPCDVVAIHDGVRPFVSPQLITKSVMVARHFGAALVAHPVRSTIKVISEDGFVASTPERRMLVAAQTPQTFQYDLILRAFREAIRMDFRATDDCQVAENSGARVIVIPGTPENIKITTPLDLDLAEAIVRRMEQNHGDGNA
jgi:2-C-methyl-D-erythritol 4-phosphate cytidylyltransferase